MGRWLYELDQILRGETTRLAVLRSGNIDVSIGGLSAVQVVLSVLYGFFMGWFALTNREAPEYRQVVAAMLKVPALFFLTLLITFPSLYVFNALVGSRLTPVSLLRLLVAALGVNVAILASFGPIVAFFSVTTTSYDFMGLLNVLFFGVAGALGLAFLLQTLQRLTIAPQKPLAVEPPETADAPEPSVGPLERAEGHLLGRNVRIVFYCWILLFGLVGTQLSWVLRPFIGDPNQPFQWFRPRQSHFFEAVWKALYHLFT
jgi:hypothetical protein